MRPTTLVLIASILTVSLAAPLSGAKHGTTEQFSYSGASVFNPGCGSSLATAVVVCGIDSPAPATATITIRDLGGVTGGGQVIFWDANGDDLASRPICGTKTIPVPPGATKLEVRVGWNLLGAWGFCASSASVGTVTVTWSASNAPPQGFVAQELYVGGTGVRFIAPPIRIDVGGFHVDNVPVGGAVFDPIGAPALRVVVADMVYPQVGFSVCQDLDDDWWCGESTANGWNNDEPWVRACGTADLATVPLFDWSKPLVVVVRAFDSACLGTGTVGTITVTYA